MTHLILHKVRGEPAFDIAEKLMIGDEEGWIIPTSGHRAYPFVVLDEHDASKYKGMMPNEWDSWPDHYQVETGLPPKADFNIMTVISKLMPQIKRRVR